ncbi:TlpA disulfide reductase family protein [Litorilituus lipolyticus]|uniref:TlpA family protein disulfide reductase n=1 Tax=Litorilituus lipolyticus TaxID=2491017 RepID=A0A502L5M8_9GAMM|nr:TlpA disulfide reductase family protein [Litorilituus lipolyticus]TPH19220.1 TlpA family protein disulfide reductase [Litorilituus lipolyticus]
MQAVKQLFIITFLWCVSTSSFAIDKAKPWQLKTQSGESISLAQFHGKPVILHFWATWCPYCKKLQPTLVELQKKYQDAGVVIVSISFREDEGAKPQDAIYQRGFSFITAVNGEQVAKEYEVRGTPTTFFLNRSHDIIFKSTSSNTEDPRLELAMKEITKQ